MPRPAKRGVGLSSAQAGFLMWLGAPALLLLGQHVDVTAVAWKYVACEVCVAVEFSIVCEL